jgi:hypothetical protein
MVLRIWSRFLGIYAQTKSRPLPEIVRRLAAEEPSARYRVNPRRLGRIVQRVLRAGPWEARCIWTSLVVYALLRRQGDEPQLVIGLPLEPKDKDAHAWVELDGVDVGPPPGRGRHRELARYG